MTCIKIGLPGKLIFNNSRSIGRPILLKIVSEDQFSGKTYFYTIASSCPSISFRARINSVAVHVPLAVGLFYFAAVDPAPDLVRF